MVHPSVKFPVKIRYFLDIHTILVDMEAVKTLLETL